MEVALKRIAAWSKQMCDSAHFIHDPLLPSLPPPSPGGQRCKYPTNPAVLDTHWLFLLESARVQDDAAQIDFIE